MSTEEIFKSIDEKMYADHLSDTFHLDDLKSVHIATREESPAFYDKFQKIMEQWPGHRSSSFSPKLIFFDSPSMTLSLWAGVGTGNIFINSGLQKIIGLDDRELLSIIAFAAYEVRHRFEHDVDKEVSATAAGLIIGFLGLKISNKLQIIMHRPTQSEARASDSQNQSSTDALPKIEQNSTRRGFLSYLSTAIAGGILGYTMYRTRMDGYTEERSEIVIDEALKGHPDPEALELAFTKIERYAQQNKTFSKPYKGHSPLLPLLGDDESLARMVTRRRQKPPEKEK